MERRAVVWCLPGRLFQGLTRHIPVLASQPSHVPGGFGHNSCVEALCPRDWRNSDPSPVIMNPLCRDHVGNAARQIRSQRLQPLRGRG
jgi:hypothetical protein